MSPSSGAEHDATPGSLRWEWRTFDDLDPDDPALAPLRAVEPVESDETYVLSLYDDASVKVREGLLDVKLRQRVDRAGLELWAPVLKATFPIDEAGLTQLSQALGTSVPASLPEIADPESALSALVADRNDLRAVGVRKARRRTVLDGCLVELTTMVVDGTTTLSLAAESTDPDLVVRTVRSLGLEGRRNTCVAAGLKTLLGWAPARFAVIDVGTNSVKLLLGERTPDAGVRIEADTSVVTRLGEGLVHTGELAPSAMDRTADAVAEFAQRARSGGPTTVVSVGTAGLRQAPNSDEFLDRVHRRCGVAVEVISGAEEARLAYVAAVASLRVSGERLLVFDSGGGSSQFTYGSPSDIAEQFSLDVGAVRATEQFGLDRAVSRETVERALSGLADDLTRLAGRPPADALVGIGGTSTNLAAHRHRLASYDADVVHGTVLDVAEVDRQIETFRHLSADERRDLPGIQPARAEVILGGACIVRTILALSGCDALTVSDRGLRHGVAAERFGAGR